MDDNYIKVKRDMLNLSRCEVMIYFKGQLDAGKEGRDSKYNTEQAHNVYRVYEWFKNDMLTSFTLYQKRIRDGFFEYYVERVK